MALPSLQSGLRPGPQGLLWVADGYTLALACGVLAAGAWSDAHGRRRAFSLGLALCGAASVGGALATGTGQVVVARLVMGCGAALLMPSTLSLITVVFPDPAARRRAVALWTFVASLGALAGPVIGGVLVGHYGWRGGFWINVPVVVLALAATGRWVPESQHPRPGQADRTGTLVVTGGLLDLVWSIISGPVRGWTNPAIGATPRRCCRPGSFTTGVSPPQPWCWPGCSSPCSARCSAGMLLVASGFAFLALAPPTAGYGPALGYQLVAGFGAGLAAAPATEAVLGAVPGERAGTGAAANDLIREVGGTLGIATLGSLLTAHRPRLGVTQTPLPHAAPAGPSAPPPGSFLHNVHERPAHRLLGRRSGRPVRSPHRRRLAAPPRRTRYAPRRSRSRATAGE
ncbi:MFS transporter [Streptomyces sp. b94]|nr:MFS transporter [Streptomyces sp. b94]